MYPSEFHFSYFFFDLELIDVLWRNDIAAEKGARQLQPADQYELDLQLLTEKSIHAVSSEDLAELLEDVSKEGGQLDRLTCVNNVSLSEGIVFTAQNSWMLIHTIDGHIWWYSFFVWCTLLIPLVLNIPFASRSNGDNAITATAGLPSVPRRRGRQSKDEQLAAANRLPLSAREISEMTLGELHKVLKNESLTEHQKQLIRKIRRRGKNKVAARTCRERRGERQRSTNAVETSWNVPVSAVLSLDQLVPTL
ncbi:unnamed protein product [Haemonchus placei]|uniref:BZIP domain-containing protein n=1 Tax=Haemonchus placei TaxID=6290 RepID=A0A3P7U4S0_HAEPC|nr:unnamed protein product [Haemonchus placei]